MADITQKENALGTIKLTQYSHGAGCGCKISPLVLDKILHSNLTLPDNKNLLVGNHTKDDAAVYDMGKGMALISTTDFFMPIVDDPFDFGRIASANAISDVYAMGGKPILAIAILGWPINILPPEIARKVIEGSRSICMEAGISLAGGHSIDSPEPIFGLAVNGFILVKNIKQNNTAKEGDLLFLTKPLGIGILTTAEKKGLLQKEHLGLAANQMMQLNKVGELFGNIEGVHAMTDVTGFGFLGHLTEMAEGSDLSAIVYMDKIPLIIDNIKNYVDKNCMPGGTGRNWDSYGEKIGPIKDFERSILADPQTSGGLLIAVAPSVVNEVKELMVQHGLEKFTNPIGVLIAKEEEVIRIKVNMSFSDWIGSIGVAILLIAFVLILTNKISKSGMIYLLMNFTGSLLATIASYLIHYIPFIILEAAWMLASLFGMWQKYTLEKRKKLISD